MSASSTPFLLDLDSPMGSELSRDESMPRAISGLASYLLRRVLRFSYVYVISVVAAAGILWLISDDFIGPVSSSDELRDGLRGLIVGCLPIVLLIFTIRTCMRVAAGRGAFSSQLQNARGRLIFASAQRGWVLLPTLRHRPSASYPSTRGIIYGSLFCGLFFIMILSTAGGPLGMLLAGFLAGFGGAVYGRYRWGKAPAPSLEELDRRRA